jgi:dienelactone hydrolase
MRMNDIDYRDEAVICRGFIAYDDTASSKRPGVLVFHEGLGLTSILLSAHEGCETRLRRAGSRHVR